MHIACRAAPTCVAWLHLRLASVLAAVSTAVRGIQADAGHLEATVWLGVVLHSQLGGLQPAAGRKGRTVLR
jgi:hypothetical protein